jgi:pimeloyl-ACP methyl ester carboxylesterase
VNSEKPIRFRPKAPWKVKSMTLTTSSQEPLRRVAEDGATLAEQWRNLRSLANLHMNKIAFGHIERINHRLAELRPLVAQTARGAPTGELARQAGDYLRDASERAVLTLDVLRERANNDLAHEAAGTPPVLNYDYEIILDGHDFAKPVNYFLLGITPPPGVEIFGRKRPYMIVDPRAGHGAGIGGFKPDSQVGVALRDGHPVYFVAFRPKPEPGQTMADVMRAEAAFVSEIRRRHPDAPKPIVVGNCQGGWAALVLAAANPDISGPLVINGAPVAAWSGRKGENPMRYNGGLLGGVVPALLLSDLGGGVFDGAHLVSNFEQLNPGRNFFGKYYDLFVDPEKGRERFLEFEKWWGGFHFMNEAEIRWIVEQIFVGNKLSRGEARIEHGRRLDLRSIRSPIIVFASKGDNITPPQQALNWIADTFTDEHEIRIRGQRIVYMIHEKVGHLGIFVSSSIARKEHTEVTSTLKTIEALAPGLYEMTIDDQVGEDDDAHFLVSFHERKIGDLLADDDDREEERHFGAVSLLSEQGAKFYDLAVRPLVQASVSAAAAETLRKAHPTRMKRRMLGDANPLMVPVREAARRVERERHPAGPANPFLALEKLWADSVIQSFDFWRDLRDAAHEMKFFGIYGSPLMNRIGASHAYERKQIDPKDLQHLPEVEAILLGVERGGFEEAVIRMLILLADSRGTVRRDRLERSAHVLAKEEPFASLGAERRAALIREQAIVVEFEPERAIAALSKLLRDRPARERAIERVEYIAGAILEMEPRTIETLQKMRSTLGLPALTAGAEPLAALGDFRESA